MLRILESAGRTSRREFLRIGGLSLGGLALSDLMAARSHAGESRFLRDKSVVLLFLQGGPPQIETFDPKLNARNAEVRSVTGGVNTKLPGVQFGGTLPKMAALADRLAVVRNFGAGKGGLSHENGYTRLLTGGKQELSDPPVGSMYARVAGSLNRSTGVPTNALLLPEAIEPDIKLGNPSGAFTFNQTKRYFATPGNLGGEYEPFDPSGGAQLLQNMTLNLPRERFDDRKSLLSGLDTLRRQVDQSGTLEASAAFRQQAYDVLMRGISEAFDLRKEDPRTLAKYDTSKLVPLRQIRRGGPLYWNNFNRTTNLLGKQMLLARRLCEAGCGFVTVVDSCWDFHDDGNNPPVHTGMSVLSPQLDHAVTAFLDDVYQRGLSDKILLVITAEMGRSPKKGGKSGGGSGHWGDLTPLVLAGGGLPQGVVVGDSDSGGRYPSGAGYGPQHLMSTIMHTLMDVGEVRLRTDLPQDVMQAITAGQPIRELV